MFLSSWAKNILFVALGFMAVATLVTSSIWINALKNPGIIGAEKYRAIFSFVFVSIGFSLGYILCFKLAIDGFNRVSFTLLATTFISFLVATALPMNDQKSFYTTSHHLTGAISDISSTIKIKLPITANLFPVSLSFLLIPCLPFLISGSIVVNEEKMFL